MKSIFKIIILSKIVLKFTEIYITKELIQKFLYDLKYLNQDEINFIKTHPEGWLDKYKEAWHLIKA